MAKIQLDMAGDVIDNDIVFDDDSKLSESAIGLSIKIVTESGSGGGWPIVELEGDRQDIINFLTNDYCDDEADVEFFVEEYLHN